MPKLDQQLPEEAPTPARPPQIAIGELTMNMLLDAIESIPEGLTYYDANDRLVLANSKMANCYPLLADKYVVGTTFEEIVRVGVERGQFGPPDGGKEEWIREVLAHHRDPKGVVEYNLADGRCVRVEERHTSDGGRVGVRTDITAIRKAEAALKESKKSLERHVLELDASRRVSERQAADLAKLAENQAVLNKRLQYEIDAKNAFFAIISHDLKSPFNALLGMTQILSQMAGSFSKDKLIEYATAVNEAGTRVFDLLQNLLEWSRLQMEGAKFDPKTVSLQAIVQENVDVLKPIALEKDIALRNDIKKVAVFADGDMVQTVIRNLLANALKFTPSGGSVEISSQERENMLQITVSDTGVGISTDQAEKIFALDHKTSTTGTAGETGTGLGLPLCKDMIERNGGSIWFESIPGGGSRFHFTLPMEPGGELGPYQTH